MDRWFRRLQFVSSGALSLSHGGSDAQKAMGVIAVFLFPVAIWATLFLPLNFPMDFTVLSLAVALGTLAGGWRIVRTMGMRLTKLRPFGGLRRKQARPP